MKLRTNYFFLRVDLISPLWRACPDTSGGIKGEEKFQSVNFALNNLINQQNILENWQN